MLFSVDFVVGKISDNNLGALEKYFVVVLFWSLSLQNSMPKVTEKFGSRFQAKLFS